MRETYYEKFYAKNDEPKRKPERFSEARTERAFFEGDRSDRPDRLPPKHKIDRKRSHAHRKELSERKRFASLRRELFAESAIPKESRAIIEQFDEIVASVRNLSGKHKVALYGAIKNLSHQLTDERNSRRLGYMNNARSISAYISYFMWWNLVRLTRLFANLPKSAFESLAKSENPVAIDVGSGTLTVVIALWLARPELRNKKISWYCMDLSQIALAAGEELYYAIAAKTIAQTELSPWNIIRVRGALGISVKEKADFISCANVFNEILQRDEQPTDFLAKKYAGDLLSYLKSEESTVLLVEPGDPHSARFISLMRDALIRRDFLPVAPCTHALGCPMSGRTGGRTTNAQGKNAKWCNFAFNTETAPSRLLKLSERAGLAKERASLSFVISKKSAENIAESEKNLSESRNKSFGSEPQNLSEKTFIRIASDFIRLPELHKSGYYACSEFGLLLAIDEHHIQPKNGELLQITRPTNFDNIDEKTNAVIVRI